MAKKSPKIDGQRRYDPNNPAKSAYFARQRAQRYSRYLKSLANRPEQCYTQ